MTTHSKPVGKKQTWWWAIKQPSGRWVKKFYGPLLFDSDSPESTIRAYTRSKQKAVRVLLVEMKP